MPPDLSAAPLPFKNAANEPLGFFLPSEAKTLEANKLTPGAGSWVPQGAPRGFGNGWCAAQVVTRKVSGAVPPRGPRHRLAAGQHVEVTEAARGADRSFLVFLGVGDPPAGLQDGFAACAAAGPQP